jgi:hypothetical protein
MLALPFGVALVWLAATALDGVAGEGRVGGLVLAAACGAFAWALWRRDRFGYFLSLALSGLFLVGYHIHLATGDANLPELQMLITGVAWLAFLLFLLLPGTRRRFGLARARDPGRAAKAPARRALRLLAALPVQALLLAVCASLLAAGLLNAWDVAGGIWRPYAQRTEPDPRWPELGIEWRMHPVDNPGDLLPNGLDPADVNGDGWPDYVTNYELEGLVRIAFHPGSALRPDAKWPGRDVGAVRNAESSALGDLDGDGLVDVVAVHGVEGTELPPAVRLYWGGRAEGQRGTDAFTWIDGGDVPASAGGWHFLYTKAIDLDADGDLDVVAGGRASRLAFGSKEGIEASRELSWAGIRWFENPGGGSSQVRDLARWRGHPIDPHSRSGHGFELGDLDGDGDLDLANASSDFDTPEAEENVVWYRNPGAGPALDQPWPVHELLRSDEWYAKEQVAIGDLDGDGRNDLLAHAPERIYWFRNLGPAGPLAPGPSFETLVIEKHEAARWRARPLELADLDGDGRLDVVGALIHHDGALARDKAAVFWMERSGSGWATHVIKWSDGFLGLSVMNGEKWDQIVPADVDGDGDLDLVANVEEYNRLSSVLAVVWFENPRIRGRLAGAD